MPGINTRISPFLEIYILLCAFLFALAIAPNITRHGLLFTFIDLYCFIIPSTQMILAYDFRLKRTWTVVGLLLGALGVVGSFIFLSLAFSWMVLAYYTLAVINNMQRAPQALWIPAAYRGSFGFIACFAGINGFPIRALLSWQIILSALLMGLLFYTCFPILTMVFFPQEGPKESLKARAQRILSRMIAPGLGAGILGGYYFWTGFNLVYALLFFSTYSISVAIAILWLTTVKNSPNVNSFKLRQAFFLVSASALIGFLTYVFLDHTHLYEAIRAGY